MNFRFGPYQLDTGIRRLTRGQDIVPLGERAIDVLIHLATHAGSVVSKDALLSAAWPDVAVGDNSLEQVISGLRRAIPDAGDSCIQTVPRKGYRFSADVTRVARRETDDALDALLAPHRAWLEGVAALETLHREPAVAAQQAFERVLAESPDYAPAHLGLANACVFQFESTRADATPDRLALARAVHHAREACRLDPLSAEAWATVGFVLLRTADSASAIAASRRAVSLEPDNWRHYLRLASVSWGEDRLRAATRTLHLLPGTGLAHWLAATVHVARQAFDAAEHELDAGAAAQDAQRDGSPRFGAVGLHWLRGLVRLRRGDTQGARDAFQRELEFDGSGHLYERESSANAWYALGAIDARAGDVAGAQRAFDEALRRLPHFVFAQVARAMLPLEGSHRSSPAFGPVASPSNDSRVSVDAAMVIALRRALGGDDAAAAGALLEALESAPAGSAGWIIPVEPLLDVSAHADVWSRVLSTLRRRAS